MSTKSCLRLRNWPPTDFWNMRFNHQKTRSDVKGTRMEYRFPTFYRPTGSHEACETLWNCQPSQHWRLGDEWLGWESTYVTFPWCPIWLTVGGNPGMHFLATLLQFPRWRATKKIETGGQNDIKTRTKTIATCSYISGMGVRWNLHLADFCGKRCESTAPLMAYLLHGPKNGRCHAVSM